MLKCSCVIASDAPVARSPSRSAVKAKYGAAEVRSGYTLNPAPVAHAAGDGAAIAERNRNRPVRMPRRDQDRHLKRPPPSSAISIISPAASWFSTPSSFAVAGEISAALSHVSFVIGSGVSCSQPLLL